MAVYMSATRQRRRMILVAVATLLVGLLIGVFIGRSTASGVDDAVKDAHVRGQNLASALRALPLEYEQASSGTAGESVAGIDDAIRRVSDRADQAVADTPWLGESTKQELVRAIAAVTAAGQRGASPSEFETAVEQAATTAEVTFGLR